jgi:hypothetical protein
VAGYGLEHVWSDQLAPDFMRSIGQRHGLTVCIETVTAPRKVEIFESLRMRLADDGLEIPDDPQFRADLLSIRKRVTMNGIAIELPRTADGRHADYAPALALAASKALADAALPRAQRTEAEEARDQEDRMWQPVLEGIDVQARIDREEREFNDALRGWWDGA